MLIFFPSLGHSRILTLLIFQNRELDDEITADLENEVNSMVTLNHFTKVIIVLIFFVCLSVRRKLQKMTLMTALNPCLHSWLEMLVSLQFKLDKIV